MLVLYFSTPGEIVGLDLIAQGQSATNALQLCSVLALPSLPASGVPVLSSDLHHHQLQNGKVTLTLAMEVCNLIRIHSFFFHILTISSRLQ